MNIIYVFCIGLFLTIMLSIALLFMAYILTQIVVQITQIIIDWKDKRG